MIGLALDTSMPVGSSTDFVDNFSFQGFLVDVSYHGLPKTGPGTFGFGAAISWNTMSEKSDKTTTWKDETICGTVVTDLSVTPLVAKVQYALRNPGSRFIPYVGIGAGGARALRRVDLGISRVTDDSWHWALVPEVGLEIPLGSFAILAATRFNYLFQAGDAPEQLFMNFSLGVGLQ